MSESASMLVHCPACAGHRAGAGEGEHKRSDQLFKGEITVSEQDTVLLQMKGIDITFPGVHALINVDFDLRHGEIHALVGENGAGKSTLIKVLTGVEKNDAGEIYLNGTQIYPKSTMHAQQLGISTVYQEVNLCPNLSVAENIFVGREPMKLGKIDWKSINEGAAKALAKLNIRLDVTRRLDEYSVAIQQMVAIARAVDVDAKVLILDEPTSSLDVQEVRNLFKIMRSLKAQGIGIIFITHFLEQIFEITDRITVLRNGNRVGNFETAGITRLQLVSTMIGKEFEGLNRSLRSDTPSEEKKQRSFYKAHNLGRHGTIQPFNLEINKNEVLGLAGLLGSGRTETASVIFGVTRPDSGEVEIDGKPANIHSPREAIRRGMGYCPENRKTEGIIAQLTIRENIILALQGKRGMLKLLSRKEQQEIADRYIKLLNIKTHSSEQLVGTLSGGNQQKVVIARWLATDPELLILDEPTRGIDVGAKAEIMKNIVHLSNEGMAVVFISSEIDEMLRCCNRMAVYRDKVKVAELGENELSEHTMMKTIAGE